MGFHAWLGLFLLGSLTLGCGGADDSEDDFQYGRADVEMAMFGTWQGSWDPMGMAEAQDFELEIRTADEPPLGEMCGNRALGTAGLRQQCISSSSLAVSATASLEDGTAADLDGLIQIDSLALSQADLYLTRDGAPFTLVLQWKESAGWDLCRAEDGGGTIVAACTLSERLP